MSNFAGTDNPASVDRATENSSQDTGNPSGLGRLGFWLLIWVLPVVLSGLFGFVLPEATLIWLEQWEPGLASSLAMVLAYLAFVVPIGYLRAVNLHSKRPWLVALVWWIPILGWFMQCYLTFYPAGFSSQHQYWKWLPFKYWDDWLKLWHALYLVAILGAFVLVLVVIKTEPDLGSDRSALQQDDQTWQDNGDLPNHWSPISSDLSEGTEVLTAFTASMESGAALLAYRCVVGSHCFVVLQHDDSCQAGDRTKITLQFHTDEPTESRQVSGYCSWSDSSTAIMQLESEDPNELVSLMTEQWSVSAQWTNRMEVIQSHEFSLFGSEIVIPEMHQRMLGFGTGTRE